MCRHEGLGKKRYYNAVPFFAALRSSLSVTPQKVQLIELKAFASLTDEHRKSNNACDSVTQRMCSWGTLLLLYAVAVSKGAASGY